MSDIEEEQKSVWQRLSLKQLRWTVVAIVLVVTAAFGGLQTAHYVTSISFGQTYNAGPVRITPHSVSITDHLAGLPDLRKHRDDELPNQGSQCRYLVLAVTIQNVANESIPLPRAGATNDCAPQTFRDTEMFRMTGIAGGLEAIFRGHESIPVPTIEPGFTNDYSVVWMVSKAELARHPQIIIRFYAMRRYISTFLIAHNWSGDANHYAELRIPNQELS